MVRKLCGAAFFFLQVQPSNVNKVRVRILLNVVLMIYALRVQGAESSLQKL